MGQYTRKIAGTVAGKKKAAEMPQPGHLQFMHMLMAVLGILSVAFLVAWMVAYHISDRIPLYHKNFSYYFSGDLVASTEYSDEFELTTEGELYRIKFINKTKKETDFSLDFTADIINEKDEIVNSFSGNFYSTSGYDDEGKWIDDRDEGEVVVKLDKPGKYRLGTQLSNAGGDPKGLLYVGVTRITLGVYYRNALMTTFFLFMVCMQIINGLGIMRGEHVFAIWLVIIFIYWYILF